VVATHSWGSRGLQGGKRSQSSGTREKNVTSSPGYGGDDAVCVWTRLNKEGRNKVRVRYSKLSLVSIEARECLLEVPVQHFPLFIGASYE
jgi:hypothetical protein